MLMVWTDATGVLKEEVLGMMPQPITKCKMKMNVIIRASMGNPYSIEPAKASFFDKCQDIVLGIGQITAKANQKPTLALFVNNRHGRSMIHGILQCRFR